METGGGTCSHRVFFEKWGIKYYTNPMKLPDLASDVLPSNRKFGLFFTFVFAILASWFYWRHDSALTLLFISISGCFVLVTILAPILLQPLNHIWFLLGKLLGKIVHPVVLGLLFFILVTPVSLVSRLFGRDELKLKKRFIQSFWVERVPTGPAPESFKNQF